MADEEAHTGTTRGGPRFHDFVAATRDLEQGRATCRGPCRRQFAVENVLTVQFRRGLVIAICAECIRKVDLVVRMIPEGIDVKLVERSGIVVVSG